MASPMHEKQNRLESVPRIKPITCRKAEEVTWMRVSYLEQQLY